MLLAASGGTILAQVGLFVMGSLVALAPVTPAGGSGLLLAYGLVVLVLVLSVCVAVAWGIIAATTSDAQSRLRHVSTTPGRAARGFLALPVILFLACGALRLWGVRWAGFVFPVGFLSLAVSLVFTLACLKRLAVRDRRPGLGQLTTVLIWLLVGGTGVATCAVALTAIQSRQMMRQIAATQAAATPPAAGQGPADTSVPPGDEPDQEDAGNGTDGAGARPLSVTEVNLNTGQVTVKASSAGTPIVPVVPSPALRRLYQFASCGTGVIFLACYVLGWIAFAKYRNLLSRAIAAAPTTR